MKIYSVLAGTVSFAAAMKCGVYSEHGHWGLFAMAGVIWALFSLISEECNRTARKESK